METKEPTGESLVQTGMVLADLARELAKVRKIRVKLAVAGTPVDQHAWRAMDSVRDELLKVFGDLAQQGRSLGIDVTDLAKLVLAIRVDSQVPDDAAVERARLVLQQIEWAQLPSASAESSRPPETPVEVAKVKGKSGPKGGRPLSDDEAEACRLIAHGWTNADTDERMRSLKARYLSNRWYYGDAAKLRRRKEAYIRIDELRRN